MERGSNKHGPQLDDEMQHETEGLTRSGRPTRAQPARDTEPLPDDLHDRRGPAEEAPDRDPDRDR